MGRTVLRCKNRYESKKEVYESARSILSYEGYEEAEESGCIVFQKGDRALTGAKFIQVDVEGDEIKVSGWILGLIGGETPLTGSIKGIAVKKSVYNLMERLITRFERYQGSIRKTSNVSVNKTASFCPECGGKNDPDSKFCKYCGKQLNK